MHCQLYGYLSEHKLLSVFQCGFRKNHSTTSAAISFTDSIRRASDQGLLTGAVFIDHRKAFDTADHGILVDKLKSYGLQGTELRWFENYLSNRQQVVGYGAQLSDPRDISSGVPQGSILGPLLFVLFVNDLPSVLDGCNILMYADDTVLYYSERDADEIGRTITKDLNLVHDWLLDNNMFLHKGKTECVLFGISPRLSTACSFSVSVQGHIIKRVTEFRYLGIVLDEVLTFSAHVKYLISKAGKRLGMLSRVRNNISMHTANVIYKSFILPVLDYCDLVWGCCGRVNAGHLERLQRRAARIIMQTSSSDEAIIYLRYDTIHQPFYQTQSCVSQVASFTPEKNSGKSSYRASVELPHFPFHSAEPPSTTSKISNPLNFLLLQTRPNCLGRSWNPSIKRPERQLHSWASIFATQHVWRLSRRETTSHLCFLSETCLYPQPSLMMPDWGLLQRKMARKNTYNAKKLPDSHSCIRCSKQRTSCTSRDNLDRAHSILIPRTFL